MRKGNAKIKKITIVSEFEGSTENFLAMLCKGLRESGMTNEMILSIKGGKPTTLKSLSPTTGIMNTTTWTVERGEEDGTGNA